MEEFKLMTIINFLHHTEPSFGSKSEIRRLIRQEGLILHMTEGPWKPKETSAFIFDKDCKLIARTDDAKTFIKLYSK